MSWMPDIEYYELMLRILHEAISHPGSRSYVETKRRLEQAKALVPSAPILEDQEHIQGLDEGKEYIQGMDK